MTRVAPRVSRSTTRAVTFGPSDGDVLCRVTDPKPAVITIRPDADPPGDGFLLTTTTEPISDPTVTIDDVRIRYSSDRVILSGGENQIAVVAEFAFYDSQLRRLEAALPPIEIAAAADVPISYRPDDAHRQHWDRLGRTMETLAAHRLTFARLESTLIGPDRHRPLADRKLFRRLRRALDVEARLESVTNRLEACEDLYEGAVDRITDHRWYRRGFNLELAIVVLLVVEVVQLAVELFLRR